MTMKSQQISYVRCFWHLISNNLKNSTLHTTIDEYDSMNRVMYVRKCEYANLLLSTISNNARLLEL